MLNYLNQNHLTVDPVYALMRREPVLAIPRRNALREDELFATRLAVAGRWEHIPVVLAQRHAGPETSGRSHDDSASRRGKCV